MDEVAVVIADGQISVWSDAQEARYYAEDREGEGMTVSVVTDLPIQTLSADIRLDVSDT